MACEKKCDKKYNPKGLNKINPYVARDLWDCKAVCKPTKKKATNKPATNKPATKKKAIKKGNNVKKLSLSRNSLLLTRAKFKKPTKKELKLRQRPNRTRKKAPSKTSL